MCGYILSCVFKSNKSEDAIAPYTIRGLRSKLISEGNDSEDGVTLLPFKMDKYAIALLVIFFAQYVILALIR